MGELVPSCDCASPEYEDSLLALVVQSNSEDGWSRVYRVSNLKGAGTVPDRSTVLEMHTRLTSFWRSPKGVLHLGDDSGEVHELSADGKVSRQVSERRAITYVWGVSDQEVYAVGDAGIVYYWDGRVWAAISEPLGKPLFAVARAPDGTIYACGATGAFWRRVGIEWQQIELPTNRRLLGLLVLADGTTWVCGEAGALFRGSGDVWEQLQLTDTNLHGLCFFKKDVYIAGSTDGVYRFDEAGSLDRVKSTVISYGLVADDKFMTSFGDRIAIRYDGEKWAGVRFE